MTALSYAADLAMARSVVTTLASVSDSLEEVLVDLRWRMAHLHGTWSGRSADAHLVTHAAWASSYDEMQAALVDMRSAIRAAHDNYSAAAEANLELWEAVR